MDKGLELIVRHAFMPNKLQYCGVNDLSKQILNFLQSGKDESEIKKAFIEFKAAYSYLSFLAEKNGLKPLDFKVGEAYFIGNDLCKNISVQQMSDFFLKKLSKKDFLGKKSAQNLAANIPSTAFFHHSFAVFYINFLTKKVKPVIENLDKCRVSWGKVIESNENNALVEFRPIELENNKLVFGELQEKSIQNFFNEKLKKGEWVSFHWNCFCQKLSPKQLENLKFFTSHNLNAINSVR